MRFGIWLGPQQSWGDVLAAAQHAERTGWDSVWFADHFIPAAGDGGLLECWTTLAALAVAVPRVRLGSLVSGNTYRHPAVLAKMAATIDHVSGGRLILGLGTGWQRNEHVAYGIELPDIPGRLGRLEEACQVIKGLYGNERTTLDGRYYTLRDAPLEPKPVQAPLPLLIGGGGERVTLRIAAQYGDEWNVWGSPEVLAAKGAVLDRHCQAQGRDPATIRRSAQALLVLSEDRAVVDAARAEADPRRPLVVGDPAEVAETMAGYRDAGVDEFIVPDFNLGGLDAKLPTMDLFIERVAPVLR